MIEEDTAVARCQRFEVACGAPESRIAARSEMQNEWWAVALDLLVEPGPIRCVKFAHLGSLFWPCAAISPSLSLPRPRARARRSRSTPFSRLRTKSPRRA